MTDSDPAPLFNLTIPSSAPDAQNTPLGTIVCTRTQSASGPIYLLTFTSAPDNRLLTSFLKTLLLALDIIQHSYPYGVVVTTSGISKFYSNGLDLEHVQNTPRFFPNSLLAVFRRFLTFPMPTVALINGHAFAGGLMLAMYHDYRVMNPSRGFLCLNELDFGAPLQPAMSSIFRQKLRPEVYRTMVLEAHRFTGTQALNDNIVDLLGSFSDVMFLVDKRKLAAKGASGIYGSLRAEMLRETLGYTESYDSEVERSEKLSRVTQEEDVKSKERVEEWKKNPAFRSKI